MVWGSCFNTHAQFPPNFTCSVREFFSCFRLPLCQGYGKGGGGGWLNINVDTTSSRSSPPPPLFLSLSRQKRQKIVDYRKRKKERKGKKGGSSGESPLCLSARNPFSRKKKRRKKWENFCSENFCGRYPNKEQSERGEIIVCSMS